MRILVTGGAGYIGSITVRHLLDRGHEITVLDSLERGRRGAVDGRAALKVGDVGDRPLLERLVAECDAVLHLAGLIDVAESQADPGHYFDVNVARPLALLRALAARGVGRLVFSSTAAVYGVPDEVPITENAPARPVNAYGASKLMFEQMIERFETSHGLRAIRLRYFNVAGAWPDGSLGEAHDPETHIIPRVLQAMKRGEDTFEVFGDDYPTPDGTCVRDYLHVQDLARAHALALERLGEGGEGGVFNLGNGRGFSNLEVVNTCASATGRRVRVVLGPRRPGDPPTLVASPERARRVLGWRPERDTLDLIVEDAWRWHQNPLLAQG
jgi:UDP-glucose 4-epimerase